MENIAAHNCECCCGSARRVKDGYSRIFIIKHCNVLSLIDNILGFIAKVLRLPNLAFDLFWYLQKDV